MVVILATIATLIGANKINYPNESHFLDQIQIKDINGVPFEFSKHKGKVILLVNVASKCGFTKQYEGLEALYQEFKEQGFVVIGVPSNDFANQEPGSAEEIKQFCQVNFGVSFPLLEKVNIKGPQRHALYEKLVSPKTNMGYSGSIKWNFTKFLFDKEGKVIQRFSPFTKPQSKKIREAILKAL